MEKTVPELTPRELADLWNSICITLPSVKVLDSVKTPGRYKSVLLRIKAHPTKAFWVDIFTKVNASDFLSGRSDKWLNCGFDWVLKPANLLKIYEGNYLNQRPSVARSIRATGSIIVAAKADPQLSEEAKRQLAEDAERFRKKDSV